MKKILFLIAFMVIYLGSFSQDTGTLTDPRDGKIYKTVKIGNQWIMAENLTYKPEKGVYWGDTIFYDEALFKGTNAKYGFLILDSSSVRRYGYFYDFNTAIAVAIPGWHVPENDEWKAVFKYLGGNAKKVYTAMIEGGSSGFNAALSGSGYIVNRYQKGRSEMDQVAYFWSSSKFGLSGNAVTFVPPATRFNSGAVRIGLAPKTSGFNVRLFKDN